MKIPATLNLITSGQSKAFIFENMFSVLKNKDRLIVKDKA
jgi:hypothetical protein